MLDLRGYEVGAAVAMVLLDPQGHAPEFLIARDGQNNDHRDRSSIMAESPPITHASI
jgi:hypothetical protein